jgi:hypothetical protein
MNPALAPEGLLPAERCCSKGCGRLVQISFFTLSIHLHACKGFGTAPNFVIPAGEDPDFLDTKSGVAKGETCRFTRVSRKCGQRGNPCLPMRFSPTTYLSPASTQIELDAQPPGTKPPKKKIISIMVRAGTLHQPLTRRTSRNAQDICHV